MDINIRSRLGDPTGLGCVHVGERESRTNVAECLARCSIDGNDQPILPDCRRRTQQTVWLFDHQLIVGHKTIPPKNSVGGFVKREGETKGEFYYYLLN